MLVAYRRVSSDDQSLDRQLDGVVGVERVFEDYPDLDYVKALRGGGLPPNIEVSEFFLKTGDYVGNLAAQQGYISTNYTFVARDMAVQGMNVIAQAVARAALAHSADQTWIFGRGWDQNRFQPPSFPDRAALRALDAAAAGHPVWLRRIDGHAGWANSVAMQQAGITRKTAEVAGGRILRDENGEPTGVLVDNAMDLIDRILPQPSGPELEAAIVRGSGFVDRKSVV